MQINMTNLKNL